ncbi:hypothetical protein DITRI_Ditri02bG0057400 [Diplodiscus trichospermus]
MRIPSANLMENPEKLSHKSKNYQKATGISSFFAFLFSILIYISIFYIFSLSPSAIFSNTKFWFVISNTLIFIIAADYSAFSSSKDQNRDVHEEYTLHSQVRRGSAPAAASSFVPQYDEILRKSIPKEEESLEEKMKEDVADEKNNIEIPERILEVVTETDHNSQAKSQQEVHPAKKADNKKKIEPKTVRRSKSGKVKRMTFNDEKKNLQRSKTENHEPIIKDDNFPAEENEFSTMSNEELNRRVEEFIQNFKGQIRLQEY